MAGVLQKNSIMQVYGHTAESSSNKESHSSIPRCRELCEVYAFLFIWNQASCSAKQPATLKLYVHHAVLKCKNSTDVITERTWHAD